MTRVRFLLTLALIAGALSACDGAMFTLDDVTQKLTIANASDRQSAVVIVDFGEARASFRMPPGTSRTATVLGATDYTVEVLAPNLPEGNSYQAQLAQMRADLVDLAGSPYADTMGAEALLGEFGKVQAALAQLHGSKTSQSCAHKATPNGHNHVTITFAQPAGMAGPGLWVLDCA
jgi:hypothetical protein